MVGVFLSIEMGHAVVTRDGIVRIRALLLSTPFNSMMADGALRVD